MCECKVLIDSKDEGESQVKGFGTSRGDIQKCVICCFFFFFLSLSLSLSRSLSLSLSLSCSLALSFSLALSVSSVLFRGLGLARDRR